MHENQKSKQKLSQNLGVEFSVEGSGDPPQDLKQEGLPLTKCHLTQ